MDIIKTDLRGFIKINKSFFQKMPMFVCVYICMYTCRFFFFFFSVNVWNIYGNLQQRTQSLLGLVSLSIYRWSLPKVKVSSLFFLFKNSIASNFLLHFINYFKSFKFSAVIKGSLMVTKHRHFSYFCYFFLLLFTCYLPLPERTKRDSNMFMLEI